MRARSALRQLTGCRRCSEARPGAGGPRPAAWALLGGVGEVPLSTSAPGTLRLQRLHSGSECWETACYWPSQRERRQAGLPPSPLGWPPSTRQHHSPGSSAPHVCPLTVPSPALSPPRALPRHSHQRRHNQADLPTHGVSTRRSVCGSPLNILPSTR